MSPYEAADPWLFFPPSRSVAASDDCVVTAVGTNFIRMLFTNLWETIKDRTNYMDVFLVLLNDIWLFW